MAAEYNRLANYFAGRSDIMVAEINADKHGEFVEQFGIRGYPTLKLFTPYGHDPIELNCGRDFESMKQYVESAMRKK